MKSKKEEVGGTDTPLTVEQEEQITQEAEQLFRISSSTVKQIAETKIINVSSKSFGIVARVEENGESVDRVVNLIFKNDALPKEHTSRFGTVEPNQEDVLIQIMENEFSDELLKEYDANKLGEATLLLPSGLSEGSPIDITFTLNENGRLDVKGVEVTNNGEINTTIETTSVISEEQVVEAKEKSKALVVM